MKEGVRGLAKCPYVFNRIEQVNQNRHEYDDDGREIFNEHKMIESRVLLDCLKEDCGVYVDGRCGYMLGGG